VPTLFYGSNGGEFGSMEDEEGKPNG